ncbi:MAG: UDP-N-acetylmuramoyl-L-alanine--D-glutamate ligase, partial [Bacillota bacterium]
MDLRNKTVLVLGLARSGVSAARVLAQRGARVIVNDRAQAEKVAQDLAQLSDLNLEIITGSHPLSIFDQPIDLVVKNPGIPNSIPPLTKAR